MSDTSAGQPTVEPTGSSTVPASTDPGTANAGDGVESPLRPAPEVRTTGDIASSTRRASTSDTDAGDTGSGDTDSAGVEPRDTAASDAAPGDRLPDTPSDTPSDTAAAAGPGTSSNARRRRRRPAPSRASGTGGDSGSSTDAGGAGTVARVSGPDAEADEPGPPSGLAAGDVGSPGMSGTGPNVDDPRPAAERPRIGDTRPARPPVVPVAPVPVTPLSARVAKPATPVSVPRTPASGSEDALDAQETVEAKTSGGRSRRRSGRERRGRPVGRYLMCVHVRPHATQIAVLEGRTLVEHYVSRASDDATQIDGNIYRGRVQNVLPGMEAAFIDIGTPKNAVLYRGDVRYDVDDIETAKSASPRIEEMLRPGQVILCQVTKNPIGAKGARLTQEVSLPGRFVVMVPNSTAFGISKRLDDNERKRLRRIVDEVRPPGHGLIVRTAAEGASQDELRHDVERLVALWAAIEIEANRSNAPGLLYREPDLAVRIVREEFNREYRNVVIDDENLYAQVRDYIEQVNPELVDRVEYYDPVVENLADLRALPCARAVAQSARPQGVVAVGGVAHHRAHRGAHRHRREHRQERGKVEPRGDRLPQQPRGRRGDRPAAPATRHRRDHRDRLHRHGDQGEP